MVRPEANFQRSLAVLRFAAELGATTKSGLMVGLGEQPAEIEDVLQALREVGVKMVTIGQYLSPSPRHLPVCEFIHPDIFAEYEFIARKLGFSSVASAPFVRSSYQAKEQASKVRVAGP